MRPTPFEPAFSTDSCSRQPHRPRRGTHVPCQDTGSLNSARFPAGMRSRRYVLNQQSASCRRRFCPETQLVNLGVQSPQSDSERSRGLGLRLGATEVLRDENPFGVRQSRSRRNRERLDCAAPIGVPTRADEPPANWTLSKSVTPIVSPAVMIAALSTAFLSSRTFPGQS